MFLLTGTHLVAKDWKVKDIPMVHLQDATRYVVNPEGILSASAVATIDSVLFALEQQTGIQTVVAVVSGIDGGDCFEFAYQLGKQNGVGQKQRDNGLVILLSTEERCIQFVTGYGLEGVLPDAICKRIQNRYMNNYFGQNKWNEGIRNFYVILPHYHSFLFLCCMESISLPKLQKTSYTTTSL